MPWLNYFHRLTGFHGGARLRALEVAYCGDKDTIALGADQRIYATVLHLDR